ncbi:hypothetical protein [Thermoanaerobacter thermocopriae]|uniref:hypothetical protein n=1 Tax=Thermoanaerobacter thermocopriae TaxID=29350 RepID=UPI000B0CE862|nr:hypothetical protein [Thermoanaerobacter thermocopriae]
MFRNITIGQYIPGDSAVHKLDPRIKIIISFIFIVAIFFINKLSGYLFAGFIFI